jgi:hypothetical protein
LSRSLRCRARANPWAGPDSLPAASWHSSSAQRARPEQGQSPPATRRSGRQCPALLSYQRILIRKMGADVLASWARALGEPLLNRTPSGTPSWRIGPCRIWPPWWWVTYAVPAAPPDRPTRLASPLRRGAWSSDFGGLGPERLDVFDLALVSAVHPPSAGGENQDAAAAQAGVPKSWTPLALEVYGGRGISS